MRGDGLVHQFVRLVISIMSPSNFPPLGERGLGLVLKNGETMSKVLKIIALTDTDEHIYKVKYQQNHLG